MFTVGTAWASTNADAVASIWTAHRPRVFTNRLDEYLQLVGTVARMGTR